MPRTTTPLHALVPTLALIVGSLGAAEFAPVPAGTAPRPAPRPAPVMPEEATAVTSTGATLVVVGDSQADAQNLPGTATVLDREVLDLNRYQNVQSSLRLVPGVSAVDEDGYGMRMNVGLRGAKAIRTGKTLILEDGIPLAPNPYNDPSLYMGPAYSRFDAVEVVKGSGQILYGPHTVSGLVNFKSRTPDFDGGGKVDASVSNFDGYSNHHKNGYRGLVAVDVPLGEDAVLSTDLYAVDADGFRRFDHVTQSELAPRILWKLDQSHDLELRLSHTAEQSNLTYQGLSRSDYEADPYNRYDFTSQDLFNGKRTAVAARHHWDLEGQGSLLSTAYAQLTHRIWDRAEHSFNAGTGSYEGTTRTTAGVTRDASARDRQYYHGGIETRWNNLFDLGSVAAEVDAGARLHIEGQTNATRDHQVGTGAYLTRDSIDRDTFAAALWAQASFAVGGGVALIPGVRVESIHIQSQRTISNYAAATDPEGSSTTNEALPSLGFTWDTSESQQFYGGVHRGFSPPSYSQAISSSGVDNELDSELSWNFEVGSRSTVNSDTYVDVALFHIDYENIIAQGVAGGPQINGGKAVSSGAEVLGETNLLGNRHDGMRLPLRLAASYVVAEYESDVYSGATLVAADGNAIEFVPELSVSLSIGVDGFGPREGFAVALTTTYVDEQFSDGLNTVAVSADASTGLIEDRLLFDLSVTYQPRGSTYEIYLILENLFDEEYVAYRRGGQGTVSGAPLKATMGMSASF